jgi:hypothetical protein
MKYIDYYLKSAQPSRVNGRNRIRIGRNIFGKLLIRIRIGEDHQVRQQIRMWNIGVEFLKPEWPASFCFFSARLYTVSYKIIRAVNVPYF